MARFAVLDVVGNHAVVREVIAMTFKDAAATVMPFGKHKGRTIDAIASNDDGLRYLDWLTGERQGQTTQLDIALAVYLRDPSIQKELGR